MKRYPHFLALIASLTLAGCGKRDDARDPSWMQSPPAEVAAAEVQPAPQPPPAQRALLTAAAQKFGDLTETAFSDASGTERRRVLAVAAAAQVRPMLTPDDQGLLDSALVEIATGLREHRQPAIALGGANAFRTILSAAGGEGALPLEVGLLDYAGFRITALNHEPQPRWEEISKTVLFANQQWSAVKQRVTRPAVANTFDHVLTALQEAAAARNSALVGTAAQQELELVDAIEQSLRPAIPANPA